MADRNIDESIRKPRRSKGTPFHRQRNYYALAILGVSGVTAVLYECWSRTQKIKKDIKENKYEYPDELKAQILERRWANVDPNMHQIVQKLREKREEKENIPQPQSWLSKIISSQPEL